MFPVLKNYVIIELIGTGAYGEVYLAEQTILKRKVAIKFLKKELFYNENIKERFLAEGRKLAKLDYIHVVKVFELISEVDYCAIVMEYIQGKSLKDFLNLNYDNLNFLEIIELFKQMLKALEYVHANGIIHRDIKLSNFMISFEGVIRIIDFGIAKEKSDNFTTNLVHGNLGTDLYMSPEQISGKRNIDERSDIYTMGVVLWEMLSAKRPYNYDESVSSWMLQEKITKEVLPLLNNPVDKIISKATQKNPQNRYPSCTEFMDDLERVVLKPKSYLSLGSLGLVISVLLAAVIFIISSRDEPEPIPEKVKTKGTTFAEKEVTNPVLNGLIVKKISYNSAVLGCDISSDGGASVNSRGVIWSTSPNPEINLTTKTNEGPGSGNFTSILRGLSPATKYYVRAYAINDLKTGYSNEEFFFTTKQNSESNIELKQESSKSILTPENIPPSIKTLVISNISLSKATTGGQINANLNKNLMDKGVVWSENKNPEVNSSSKIELHNNSVEYKVDLENLKPGVTYYVRAFLRYNSDVIYGDELSFKTLFLTCPSSVRDVDGTNYKTVLIGNQCWMAENLKVTHYNDGTPIVYDRSGGRGGNEKDCTWNISKEGKRCTYSHTSLKYGYLYNWYAASNTKKVCPSGWRLPSNTDWNTLSHELGDDDNAGRKLKSDSDSWRKPNDATNASGFSALGGGFRTINGTFGNIGLSTSFWSSSEVDVNHAWLRELENSSSNFYPINSDDKLTGAYVRCVKN